MMHNEDNPQTSAAMDKIRDDMAAHAKDNALQVVGGVLTELLQLRPEITEKIMEKKKDLSGAMNAMKEAAQKVKAGSWACLDIWQGMAEVLRYFDIDDAHLREAVLNYSRASEGQPEAAPAPAPEPDALDLDALLGGD